MLDQADDKGIDAHGNYSTLGEMHRPRETLESLVPRVLAHLHATFPGYEFTTRRSVYALGRSLTVCIVGGPKRLTDEAAQDTLKKRIRGEMEKFERASGNVYSDYHQTDCLFFVEIDPRYHVQHAEIPEGAEVEKRMSLAEFRRTLKAGDRIVTLSTNNDYALKRGVIGVERTIRTVRSGDFIIDEGGKDVYFSFPKSGAFACDGERFRVASPTPHNPDQHALYRWIRN